MTEPTGLADYDSCDHLVLSLGGGVQSSAITVMAYSENDYGVPEPDQTIFADTGNEPKFVYEWLETLDDWLQERGGEIETVQKGDLWEDLMEKKESGDRFASIPAWSESEGRRKATPLRRQCTREYKIEPIKNHVRHTLGYKKGEAMKNRVLVGMMLGISTDEVSRAKQGGRPQWTRNIFPLLDIGYSRDDCMRVYDKEGFDEKPKKSSCVFCPYHDDNYWAMLKREYPEEFKRAVKFDKQIREMSMSGDDREIYLHKALDSLDELDFEEATQGPQMGLFNNQCGGHCGV